MHKVIVFGTFDKLHKGHINFFKQAKEYGGYLVVVVARDKTVEKVKGKMPKNDELTRVNNVERARYVNAVRLGYLGDPYRVIMEEKPEVICLGYDQEAFTDKLNEYLKKSFLNIDVIRLEAFKPTKYKSSLIKGKSA